MVNGRDGARVAGAQGVPEPVWGVFMGQERATHKVPKKTTTKIDWLSVWTTEGRRAILWLPVLMGCGIWLYFTYQREPDPLWCALTALPVAALANAIPSISIA